MFATVRGLVRDESGSVLSKLVLTCLIVGTAAIVLQPPQLKPYLNQALEMARSHMPESITTISRTLTES